MPEKIEGFYLDGTKYEFDGGGTEYNAGEGISIGDVSINARKGPSPDGFHVPSTAECEGLKTIMDSLSLTTGDSWRINLHIPFAGRLDYNSAVLEGQGSHGYYWSSSPNVSEMYEGTAFNIHLASSYMWADESSYFAYGSPIRCFKDSYMAPDSNWIVVQGTLGSTGIFWNQSEGLISITDGSTGYTIMDKNLGATTVYNDGDTLTQSNMGNMYQWGNNYGFPSIGTISKTSSTQVDASNYGPTNPYSSDTFITGNIEWSSVQNYDLWGDITETIIQENAISNTGVLSVNGQTGDVTITSPDMSNYLAKDNTTAFTPTGDYHPATKKYVDDNAGTEYNAGEGIEIKDGPDYSAMRGPCEEGFHVPLYSEASSLTNMWKILGLPDSNISSYSGTYLKLPGRPYYRSKSSSVLNNGIGCWTASYGTRPYAIQIQDSFYVSDNFGGSIIGLHIRAFKDTPIAPDNSWTTLYDGNDVALGAGIFWSSTLGLISISSDGINWITIKDKNEGATTVYNQGDTLTGDNCGKFFQWGNNYAFPFSGSVTTSSTKIDALGYGPDNYYSSSTFITDSSSNYVEWFNSANGNLRGGETGGIIYDNTIINTGLTHVYELGSSPTINNIQQIHNLVLKYGGENLIVKWEGDTPYVVGGGDDNYILSFIYQGCVERDAHDSYQGTYHSFKSIFYEPYNGDNFILYILWYKTDYNSSNPKAVIERGIKAKKISVT